MTTDNKSNTGTPASVVGDMSELPNLTPIKIVSRMHTASVNIQHKLEGSISYYKCVRVEIVKDGENVKVELVKDVDKDMLIVLAVFLARNEDLHIKCVVEVDMAETNVAEMMELVHSLVLEKYTELSLKEKAHNVLN